MVRPFSQSFGLLVHAPTQPKLKFQRINHFPDGNLSEVEDSESDSDEVDYASVDNNKKVEVDAATEEAQPTTSTAKKNTKVVSVEKSAYKKRTLLIWGFQIHHQMRYCLLLLISKCLLMMSA